MRIRFDFLPEYYGTITTADDERNDRKIIVNIFEYVAPLTFTSRNDIDGVFEFIRKPCNEKFSSI